jgi:hypothetical protein
MLLLTTTLPTALSQATTGQSNVQSLTGDEVTRGLAVADGAPQPELSAAAISSTAVVTEYDYLLFVPMLPKRVSILWQEDFETISKPPAPNCNGTASFYQTQIDLFLPFSKPDPGFVCLPDDCPYFGYVEAGNDYHCSNYARITLQNNPAQAQSGDQYLELNVNIGGQDGSDYARRIEMRKGGWRVGGAGTWNIGKNELWRSAWFYIPDDVDIDSWIELMDIVERRASPAGWYEKYNQIQITALGYLYIGQQFNGTRLNGQTSSQKVPTGRWVHLEEHFFRSASEDGFVEVYIDGDLWLANYNIRTMFNPNTAKRGTALSFKLYTDRGTAHKTVYWDNIIISRTRYSEDQQITR